MDQSLDRRSRDRRRKARDQSRRKVIRYILAAAAILLAVNILFEITDIQVEGNVIYSSQEIAEASGLRVGITGLDPTRLLAPRRIRGALPGISSARVSMILPDRMVISVEETAAVAVLETEGGRILLSEDCTVVSGFRGDEGELIRVTGLHPLEVEVGETLSVPETESTKLTYLREMLELILAEDLRSDVRDLDFSNVSDLHFTYLERFTVRMGTQESLASKLDFLRRIVQRLGAGDSGVLDMSTPQKGHYFPN